MGVKQPVTAGQPRTPAWWSDPKCDATRAYHIISKRFKVHGPQSESATCSTFVPAGVKQTLDSTALTCWLLDVVFTYMKLSS